MSKLTCKWIVIVIPAIILFVVGTVSAACQGKFKNRQLTSQELKTVLNNHSEWFNEYGKSFAPLSKEAESDHRKANLCLANLSGANLKNATLSEADLTNADLSYANLENAKMRIAFLEYTNLTGANLTGADLRAAILYNANLRGAKLEFASLMAGFLDRANLSEAHLMLANLSGARLWSVNLSNAGLVSADLSEAYLVKTNLSGANLIDANLSRAIFEPNSLPKIDIIAQAKNLELMRYESNPEALIKLRKAFKEAGFYKQEKKITYAIKHCETIQMLRKVNWEFFEGVFSYVFFDMTTCWGMEPRRALLFLLLIIPFFATLYTYALVFPGMNGVWRKWSDDRIRTDLGTKKAEQLRVRGLKTLALGLYFSVLSTFNLGWRDLNVGNWIQRLQPREYTLRATGWVRTVSGLQSLISLYLLAIWVLTYFGRPFGPFE